MTFLMTLYLGPDLTIEEIRKAAKAGVVGEHYLLMYLANGFSLRFLTV